MLKFIFYEVPFLKSNKIFSAENYSELRIAFEEYLVVLGFRNRPILG